MASDHPVIDRLRVTVRDLLALTSGATPDQLAKAPAEGEWSAAQVVAHLTDAELVYSVRLRMVLIDDHPALAAYDENAWAARFGALDEDPKFTVARWRALREHNLRLFRSLAAAEWERAGLHEERGRLTVAAIAELMADHDRTHLDQIRTALA